MTRQTLNVLLVDDSVDDAELIARSLRRVGCHFTCRRVDTREALERALAEPTRWDVIVCEAMAAPRPTLASTLRRLHQCRRDVPVVIASGWPEGMIYAEIDPALTSAFVSKDRLEDLPATVAAVVHTRPMALARLGAAARAMPHIADAALRRHEH